MHCDYKAQTDTFQDSIASNSGLTLPCFGLFLPSSGQRATLRQVSYIHIQLMSFEIPQAIWTKQRENIKALTRCRSKKARGQINAVPFRIRSSRFGAMSPALHSRRYYVGQSLVAPPFPVLPRWAHHRRFTFVLQSLNFSEYSGPLGSI